MATRALDVVTIMHALSVLSGELNIPTWSGKNSKQAQLFNWLAKYQEQLAQISGLEALASRFHEELNRFLTDRKFDPMVKPFDPTQGVGVVSVLDKLVRWLNGPGQLVQIRTIEGNRPGFELPASGVNIFHVDGYPGSSYLLEVLTQSDDTLWLFVHNDTSLEGLDMVSLSMEVMRRGRSIPMARGFRSEYPAFAGAQIPMVDFDVKPDLSWLLGADAPTESGDYYFIAQAAQQYKMRMDETGARVKAATVVVAMRGISEEPRVFVIDVPFYGWLTQKGVDLPMAAFFADLDSFHKPAGSLEDL